MVPFNHATCKMRSREHNEDVPTNITAAQVVVVGDLNAAASQRDVHAKLCWDDMYGAEEKAELAALLRALPDVWRLRHPDATNAFTARPS